MRSLCPLRSASALLAAAAIAAAGPFPRGSLGGMGYSHLLPRDVCDGTPCGSDGQYCCGSSELCTTLGGNVATCLAGYGAYTSTWTETRTFTTTYYTHWAPVPTPTAGVDCQPQDPQQEACGPICCAGWQTCAFRGQCSAKPGYAEPTAVVITTNGFTTTQYSAPYRVTGTTTITTQVVQTGTGTGASATSTGDSEAIGAGGKGTNSGGLSPGAIAGIVIGTLAGVALLLLLCFCCIARGLWAAIFGRRRSGDSSLREEVIEERYSKSGSRAASASAHSRRDRHGGWFGGSSRPGASTVVTDRREKRKSSSGSCWAWLGIGAVVAMIFTMLNLKKDKRPNSRKTPSRHSNSYYSQSDYTSSNTASSSSGQRSRSRRSRSSRGGRSQQYTRTPKRP
ncbi:hypothetical protein Trco_006486 [Trichoderma cornu-damae]|uniref:Mid2 domain-containing protein n=1 Tax=Trichoderma cornu-damae TaxID=654480 RepID=A0A9P8TV25_9HYPO|nr:hypothetical protein Trco_006486 [Trichoderma cornu-damae]